jgi:hypothetical protein
MKHIYQKGARSNKYSIKINIFLTIFVKSSIIKYEVIYNKPNPNYLLYIKKTE